MSDAHHALARTIRDAGRDVLATLTRWTGDLALSEDAVQDATMIALDVWARDGVPPNPVAWLRLTARRRALDMLRRESVRVQKERWAGDDRALLAEPELPDVAPTPEELDDNLLRLVFTCCHPSLALDAQVALSLRTLCGLSTAQVARALLTTESTMAKRLTRTRQKIAAARIPYRVPPAAELPDRWAAVLSVAYLMFNEGYCASSGDDVLRHELLDEAIRLTRLLRRLRPDDVSVTGLLALMLLHDSRRRTRTDSDGNAVLLADQDRLQWDREFIEEGVELVGQALLRSPDQPDRHVVHAAIAACHAIAPTFAETDWNAIVSWYDVLLRLDQGPVARLNRAVAVGERDGPAAGLALVDAIEGLSSYPLWHATRSVLLRRAGFVDEADLAAALANKLPLNRDQQRSLSVETGRVLGGTVDDPGMRDRRICVNPIQHTAS